MLPMLASFPSRILSVVCPQSSHRTAVSRDARERGGARGAVGNLNAVHAGRDELELSVASRPEAVQELRRRDHKLVHERRTL